jgi:Uma2 family endonuclease
MSLADPPARPMTAEALMALPDDGVDRELIRGELRERPAHFHTPNHSGAAAAIASLLVDWIDQQSGPRGMILTGAASFRLCRRPESIVGIDVAYASPELVASTGKRAPFFEGPPVLAVEILAPWDTQGDIVEKVELFLELGTMVWVVDPDFRTVSVHRPRQLLQGLNTRQELSGEPELPGFRVAVAKVFRT